MKPEDALNLSFYREVAVIEEKENTRILLVQHVENRDFFVKKILTSYDPSVYRMLQARHFSGIPQIFYCVEENGTLILIEEYIKGSSLSKILDSSDFFSETEAAALIVRLCDILSPLHTLNPPVIHRDIKPANILISSDGVPKLIDFNAAKQVQSEKTRDTILMGTADYAAPEQYGFRQSDPRTDIYALGVLLNRILIGKVPRDALYQGTLTGIIRRCTELNPDRRYQSAEDLKRSLQHAAKKIDSCRAVQDEKARSFLPPGFRKSSFPCRLLSAAGYFFVLYLCSSLTLEEPIPTSQLYLNRIFTGIAFFALIAFLRNYRGIQRFFPLMKRSGLIRLLGYLIGIILILFCVFGVLVFLESIFWPAS